MCHNLTQHYPVENNISHKYNLSFLVVTFKKFFFLKKKWRDFPGGPVAKTPLSNTGDAGLIPEHGAKIPHALQPSPPAKTQNCNKFNKDFKNGPHQKKTF